MFPLDMLSSMLSFRFSASAQKDPFAIVEDADKGAIIFYSGQPEADHPPGFPYPVGHPLAPKEYVFPPMNPTDTNA